MDYSNIRVEKRDLIAVVTLDRPKVLNALNAETLLELGAAFESLGSDSTIRAVLLAGAGGRAFAAGADIRELAAIPAEKSRHWANQSLRVSRDSRSEADVSWRLHARFASPPTMHAWVSLR